MALKFVHFKESPSGNDVAVNPHQVLYVIKIDELISAIILGHEVQVTVDGTVDDISAKLEKSVW
jgi:hypothetical protein